MKRHIVKCSGGCGKSKDLTREAQINKELGFKGRPKWLCADCYRAEEAAKKGQA